MKVVVVVSMFANLIFMSNTYSSQVENLLEDPVEQARTYLEQTIKKHKQETKMKVLKEAQRFENAKVLYEHEATSSSLNEARDKAAKAFGQVHIHCSRQKNSSPCRRSYSQYRDAENKYLSQLTMMVIGVTLIIPKIGEVQRQASTLDKEDRDIISGRLQVLTNVFDEIKNSVNLQIDGSRGRLELAKGIQGE